MAWRWLRRYEHHTHRVDMRTPPRQIVSIWNVRCPYAFKRRLPNAGRNGDKSHMTLVRSSFVRARPDELPISSGQLLPTAVRGDSGQPPCWMPAGKLDSSASAK